MTRTQHLTLLIASVAALLTLTVGCGDEESSDKGPSITGTYEVTTHTLSDMGCENPEPVEMPADCFDCAIQKPFVKLKTVNFFGVNVLSAINCDSATECDDKDDDENTLNLSGPLFDMRTSSGWTGLSSSGFFFSDECNYSKSFSEVETTEDGIRFTTRTMTSKPDLDEAGCTALDDNPPADSTLTCEKMEIVEAKTAE